VRFLVDEGQALAYSQIPQMAMMLGRFGELMA
jgi:hypothetical protein